FAGNPGKVKRIDRNAMPAKAGSRVERLESKGFGACGLNHFPYVYPHSIKKHFEFVDEGNIDGPVGVLENLAGLGHFRAGSANDLDHDFAVKSSGKFQAVLVEAADDLGNVGSGILRVAGILTLGAERQKEIDANLESAFFENRFYDLACR